MKIKEGFNLRHVGGEHMVVAQGIRNVDFSKIISLNDTAAYLWSSVEGREFTADTLARLIVGRYDVDPETARKDAEELAVAWINAGIVAE